MAADSLRPSDNMNACRNFILLSFAATLLSACAWVAPTVSGNAVRVAYDGNVAGCRDAGAISVAVADKIGFYHRSGMKVRDELESLARNQAASVPADTIKATSEPKDGSQSFEAYICAGVRVQQRDAKPDKDAVQTFPVKDH